MTENTTQTQPTRPGQFVRDIRTGQVGITTEFPMKRKPAIGVMFAGSNYSVLAQVADLVRVRMTETGE